MKTIVWAISYGVVAGLLVGGVIFLISQPPRGEPVKLLPSPTEHPLLVHVIGAVNLPGVYSLPPGSRVADAIQAANGFNQDADQVSLNLAEFLKDGDQVFVPHKSITPDEGGVPDRSGTPLLQPLVNINIATQSELESLPQIGPVIALEIISYRQENGPFITIEAIQEVPGIGPAIFENIRNLITVGEIP